MTLYSHPLSSSTLSPIDETMVDLVSELGSLLARRLLAKRLYGPRIRRVLHSSAPSAPSALSTSFEIAQDPIDHLAVYSKRRPKINIKTIL